MIIYIIYNSKNMLTFFLLLLSLPIFASDRLGFVFELNRHGARAPSIDDEPGLFKVPSGMLTASGMRQRHMLGKFNRQRYVEEYGLLDGDYNPN